MHLLRIFKIAFVIKPIFFNVTPGNSKLSIHKQIRFNITYAALRSRFDRKFSETNGQPLEVLRFIRSSRFE